MFSSVVQWISTAIDDDKGIVLVHCDQGVSRSSTVIIAYLLYSNTNLSTVDKAFNLVKSARSIIRPNPSFMEQLEQYLINIRKNNENIKIEKENFDEC
jgi:dual specificity phosphatase 12